MGTCSSSGSQTAGSQTSGSQTGSNAPLPAQSSATRSAPTQVKTGEHPPKPKKAGIVPLSPCFCGTDSTPGLCKNCRARLPVEREKTLPTPGQRCDCGNFSGADGLCNACRLKGGKAAQGKLIDHWTEELESFGSEIFWGSELTKRLPGEACELQLALGTPRPVLDAVQHGLRDFLPTPVIDLTCEFVGKHTFMLYLHSFDTESRVMMMVCEHVQDISRFVKGYISGGEQEKGKGGKMQLTLQLSSCFGWTNTTTSGAAVAVEFPVTGEIQLIRDGDNVSLTQHPGQVAGLPLPQDPISIVRTLITVIGENGRFRDT